MFRSRRNFKAIFKKGEQINKELNDRSAEVQRLHQDPQYIADINYQFHKSHPEYSDFKWWNVPNVICIINKYTSAIDLEQIQEYTTIESVDVEYLLNSLNELYKFNSQNKGLLNIVATDIGTYIGVTLGVYPVLITLEIYDTRYEYLFNNRGIVYLGDISLDGDSYYDGQMRVVDPARMQRWVGPYDY